MQPIIIIAVLGGLILMLLVSGFSIKPFKFIGQSLIKLIIGALLLFFLNVAGNRYGLHVPINFATSAVSGFLGIPGLCTLIAIEKFVL